jgi:hypothetical protein
MNESIPIEVSVKLEARDYWRYYFGHIFGFERVIWNLFTAVLFSLFLLFSTFDDKIFSRYGWRFIFTGVIFYFALLGLNLVSSASRSQKAGETEALYVFSNSGISIKTSSFESQIFWTYVRRVKETREYFKISLRGGHTPFVPKRFFKDPEDVVKLKELFFEKTGQEAYLKKTNKKLGLK